jgi:hypothetical protein
MRYRKELLVEWDSADTGNHVQATASYTEMNENGKAGIQEAFSGTSIDSAIEWGREFFNRAPTKKLTPANATPTQA